MMDMRKSLFIEYFGDYPKIRVLDFLIENDIFDYSKKDIARYSGVAFNTLNGFFKKMVDEKIIIKTRKVGKATMFKLNKESPFVKILLEIDKQLMKKVIKETEKEELTKAIKL